MPKAEFLNSVGRSLNLKQLNLFVAVCCLNRCFYHLSQRTLLCKDGDLVVTIIKKPLLDIIQNGVSSSAGCADG